MKPNKQDLIMDAALKLFVEHGFHGTATGKIAQEAGVANGTLFIYFKTKDELVLALYIKIKNELNEYIAANKPDTANYKEKIKAHFLSAIFWALDNDAKFRFIQLIHSSPYINLVDQNIIKEQVTPHLSLIKEGVDAGDIKSLPADFIYALIASQTLGLYQYLTSAAHSKTKQHDIIQTAFELLWDMLK